MASSRRVARATLPLLLLAHPASSTYLPSRAGLFPSVWTTSPKQTPSQAFPDGPFIGDGNIEAVVGGSEAEGSATLYITSNGFWGVGYGSNSTWPSARPPEGGFRYDPFSTRNLPPPPTPRLGFPGCPAENCSIPVGLTMGTISFAHPSFVRGQWGAGLFLDNATFTVSLAPNASSSSSSSSPDPASLVIGGFIAADDDGQHLIYLTLTNPSATEDLVGLNVSVAANDNVLRVPVSTGCVDPSSGSPIPSCPSSPSPSPFSTSSFPAGLYARKASAPPGASPFPMDGVIALRPLLGVSSPGVSASNYTAYSFVFPSPYWATSKDVDTVTWGTAAMVTLPAGATLVLVASAAGGRDPDVPFPTDPAVAVAARLAAAPDTPSAFAAAFARHASWWSSFWSPSSIALDASSGSTEGFWYTSLYTMALSSRPGQLTSDLWAGLRTTDYPLWRSDLTSDYNMQAQYAFVVGANHRELSVAYYGFLDQLLESGGPQAESAYLGCPGGAHLSVDLIPFGIKLGVQGIPADWGILTNGAYAAVQYAYEFAASAPNATWVESVAWPFMTKVAAFWTCTLVKTEVAGAPDGYEYFDIGDSTGDESSRCPLAERTNPMWAAAYLRRLFSTLIEMSAVLGKEPDPQWVDVLAHLPPVPVAMYQPPAENSAPVPVLAWYGVSNWTNFAGQANELHGVFPGEIVSCGHPNQTLVLAAQNALDHQSWTQDNTQAWLYAAASRVGYNLTTLWTRWEGILASQLKTNRLISFGGLCSDSLGMAQFVQDALVQGQEGFLRLFPAWPGDRDAQFSNLRMRGALLVGASYVGQAGTRGTTGGLTGGTAEVVVTAEVSGNVTVLSPWPHGKPGAVNVCDIGPGGVPFRAAATAAEASLRAAACTAPVQMSWSTIAGVNGGPALTWAAAAGSTYSITTSAGRE
jgi:hypothetical protein